MNDLVAHDLRSPMQTLYLYGEELKKILKSAKKSTNEDEINTYLLTARNYMKIIESANRGKW